MSRFLSIDEQISLLQDERHLEIPSKNRFSYYLKSYNFENIIKRYDRFFLLEKQSGYKYQKGVTSEDIIDIFNFDRAISQMILPNLLNIERKLATAISTVLCEKFTNQTSKNYIREMEKGLLLNISSRDFSFIFPKIDSDEINAFKYELAKHTIKSNKMKIKYGITDELNVRNIPLWELSVNWTFGNIIEILTNIRKEIRTKIVKYYFQKDKLSDEIIDNFISVVKLLNIVKNRTYHNNQIFDIEIKLEHQNINSFIEHLELRDPIYAGSNSIRLYDIITIIDYLWHLREYNLFDRITALLNECIKINKTRLVTWRKCISFMKFYKFIV